ncbi:MAG TPA: carboxypeptidase regulatory-like domain-containing protein [Candidatus Acidoferrales bacterium]|nr:carboxypeptidase regulatory-like domain-containing protein [Candidatus Acidoferrales bacterium]
MKKFWGVVFVFAGCLALASSAWGQAQITTGTIQGEVVDEKGGSVPDATVEIRNLDTNFSRTQTTGSDGRFAFLAVASGRYKVTISKAGFATVVQENVSLTVGQSLTLPVTMKVSAVAEQVIVTATPTVEVAKTESSTTLNQLTVSETPVLGRKFEDLLTLTPGVSIVQGPDGDEINFNGQRGIFNNISLDGGDYNNGFFGEQLGGQRAAIDITMEAVKEFQVVASGASAEFGRTAGGVINVITKSGTNEFHGSGFGFFRTEGLSSNTSDGKPLKDFSRQQFGGTFGGPILRDKAFFFGSAESIREKLTRDNLSAPIGTPCAIPNPVFNSNITDAQISASADCQRLTLINFLKSGPLNLNQNEGLAITHPIRNTSVLGRLDWLLTPSNQFSASYNFDYSKNENQTFDVPTYGNSANGTEGPSHIHVINANVVTTLAATKLNEAHFTYQRELRPRAATTSSVPADTAMGFATTFRFGAPFFLEPNIDELIWRTQVRDNFSLVLGTHTFKVGGEWIHTINDQTFRGFFTGRYIFDSVVDFLHYATPGAPGSGFGPTSPGLIFYLQDGVPTGISNVPAPGASDIKNNDFALFIQDKWQMFPSFTFNYGLRWEAQKFPSLVLPPNQTAYGIFLSNPAFPSNGTEHSQWKEFQPRVGFAWDILNNHKSVLRASYGIYYARQNMLSEVGSITTNGAQQRTIFFASSPGSTGPTWPNAFPANASNPSCPGPPVNPFPCFTGVRVFSKDYANPRIYATNVSFEQELFPSWAAYVDFSMNKGVHLTRFFDVNGNGAAGIPAGTFSPDLGSVFVAESLGKSLYRGVTFGVRKRFSQRFQMEANYVYSKDYDDDSDERDPFTDRRYCTVTGVSCSTYNLGNDYASSDRDRRHKFNYYLYAELPWKLQANVRMQASSAQPVTPINGVGSAIGTRNSIRKDNKFFIFDWRVSRPISLGERFKLIPILEMFNTFNNDNNIDPLTFPGEPPGSKPPFTPSLFNFDGFLRSGVGDPRQVQLAIKFTF